MEHIEEIKDYWNLRANGFSSAVEEELETESGKEWKAYFEEKLMPAPAYVLDCGCGPGFFPAVLEQMGYQVSAIDYSDEMVDRAKKRLISLNLEADVRQMDAQNLKFDDQSFDAVVTRNVLWNLDNPGKALSEMTRVLKPGGILIIEDGNMYLYQHDEDYARQRNEFMKTIPQAKTNDGGLHGKHNTDKVDFSVIEKIAEDLPMSFKRRPQWDFEQLIRLGYTDIQVQTKGAYLPFGFRIRAVKCSEEEDKRG